MATPKISHPFPELLLPAGSLLMLKTAFAFGADAVYAGQPRYSLRVRNNEFSTIEKLALGVEITRTLGKKFYLVSNIYPRNAKLKTYLADMAPVIALKPDALIMSDPGLIYMVKNEYPDQCLHLSVQANTTNWAAVRFWQKQGISRVILSRELSLEEIAEIRRECPAIEIEVFIHGALCIAYSGRCLMSGYFNHRDANQGSCTNACRWEYQITEPAASMQVMVEEKNRPGEDMLLEEDEHGTYLFNSKDLRAIEHVEKLCDIGVDSFKIEGRTKSAYYAARTSQAYRAAIDDWAAGREFNPTRLADLENLAHRGYTDGFFQRHHEADYQNYLEGHSVAKKSRYVGDAVTFDHARQKMKVAIKNRLAVGDTIECVHPSGNQIFSVTAMENAAGKSVEVAPGIGHIVWLPLPPALEGAFLARLF